MPIFEYQCQACHHTFDALQKVGEGPLRKCPECGKLKLKKLLSAPSFHLKGSGWYKTDFRDKGTKKKDGDDKPAASGGTGSTNSGSSDADSGSAREGGSKEGGSKESGAKPAHTLDSGKSHSHDHGHGHGHSHGGHSHGDGPGKHKH